VPIRQQLGEVLGDGFDFHLLIRCAGVHAGGGSRFAGHVVAVPLDQLSGSCFSGRAVRGALQLSVLLVSFRIGDFQPRRRGPFLGPVG